MKPMSLGQAGKFTSPNPVSLVCTETPSGATNLATVSWWTPLSYNPGVIGFAMAAAGTDTAIETADVALMDDDLRKIPRFVRLSKATYAILVQNISLAVGVKAAFFALALAGEATMWMAVFADVGTSLLVVANGLRAMRK